MIALTQRVFAQSEEEDRDQGPRWPEAGIFPADLFHSELGPQKTISIENHQETRSTCHQNETYLFSNTESKGTLS